MEKAIQLSGTNLFIQDLSKLNQGTSILLDPQILSNLNQSPLQEEPPDSPYSINTLVQGVLKLNSLLRNGTQVRQAAVQSIFSLLQAQTVFPLSISQFALSPVQSAIFSQPKHTLGSRIGLILGKIQMCPPFLQASVSLFFQANNINSNILSQSNFSGLSTGSKDTLENLSMLLQDSKLSNRQPALDISQLVYDVGLLKDLISSSVRTVQREINSDLKILPNQTIERSLQPISTCISGLFNILVSLRTFLQIKLNQQIKPAMFSNDPFEQASLLQEQTEILLALIQEFIDLSVNSLTQLQAQISAKAGQNRPLQLGKGSRIIYKFLTENPQNTNTFFQFVKDLLTAKNEQRRIPKLAKGMRDFGPQQMSIRDIVFTGIRKIFKKHMAGQLDTPVMELKQTLTGKYGQEGSKLIYDIADQGGELLSLRYDLTVPFARYVAMNRISNWKRFQIGKVYRRDQPQMNRGRYREFYQCDFDIVGVGAPMIQQAQILKIVVEIMQQLGISFLLKVNHRKILDAILLLSGCPENKFRTVSSTIDKLDKEEWSKVRQQMIIDKGLSEQAADLIGQWVLLKGSIQQISQQLLLNQDFAKSNIGKKAAEQMRLLAGFIESFNISQNIQMDLSLARGLDYYTGLVYEVILADASQGVGSIAGGGRYDQLIMKLSNSKNPVPAIGVSFGVQRMFTILEQTYKDTKMIFPKFSVVVASAGTSKKYNLLAERLKIANVLWENGIAAQTSYKAKSDPKGQAGYADEMNIPFVVWVGESEIDNGKVRVKDMKSHEEQEVLVEGLVEYLNFLAN